MSFILMSRKTLFLALTKMFESMNMQKADMFHVI